jgi:hypothetical protein
MARIVLEADTDVQPNRMTKQLRLGEVDTNKDDLQKAIKLLALHLMSGSSSMANQSVDLAIYMLLKVSCISQVHRS